MMKQNRDSKYPNLMFSILLSMIFLLSVCSPALSAGDTDKSPSQSREPVITDYAFGQVNIDDKEYKWDVTILETGQVKSWGFSDSHEISMTDIQYLLNENVKELIIGSGYNGVAEVDQEVLDYLKEKGIKMHIAPTEEAVEMYNKSQKNQTVACFHLDC